MSRELGKFRMVFTGISQGPSKAWCEYLITDEGMEEPHKRSELKRPDYNLSLRNMWRQSINKISQEEEL
jgi:hypothetical protein